MNWRHLSRARALLASGLFPGLLAASALAAQPADNTPGAEPTADTVQVLDAQKAGTISVDLRGSGQDRVRVVLRNNSDRKLHVVLPPGLVASSAVGQGPGGGGGGAGGPFQSMGLGAAGNQTGGFGQFAGRKVDSGFRSIPAVDADALASKVTVPANQRVDFEIPAVCLNYGKPTPSARDRFTLVSVDDFSTDARVRKSLRALASLGTSQGTAQAAMWRVCNDVPFEAMVVKGSSVVNAAEASLASRFVDAIDAGLDPASALSNGRIFVSIVGEGAFKKDGARLASELSGLQVMGLPVSAIDAGKAPEAMAPMLHLGVILSPGASGETRGRVVVQSAVGVLDPTWKQLGVAKFQDISAASSLDGASLVRAIDRAVSAEFVSSRVARKTDHGTVLEIRNRLPFSVAGVVLKAGNSAGSPMVDASALGIGPNRTGLAAVPASIGSVERVELNGL